MIFIKFIIFLNINFQLILIKFNYILKWFLLNLLIFFIKFYKFYDL